MILTRKHTIICWLVILLIIAGTRGESTAQQVSSARGLSLGAKTADINDLQSLDWNPAGLSQIIDWEVTSTNFGNITTPDNRTSFSGIYFQNFGIAKRFLNTHSFGIRYSPGTIFEATIPSTYTYYQTTNQGKDSIAVSYPYNKKVHYAERYSIGYSYLLKGNFSLGIAARLLEQRIDDAIIKEEYIPGTQTKSPKEQPLEYTKNSWNVDIGAQWQVSPSLWIGAVGKNVSSFDVGESSTQQKEKINQILFNVPHFIRFGVGYYPRRNIEVGIDADTRGAFSCGYEWNIAGGLIVRQGLALSSDEGAGMSSTSIGVGYSFSSVTLDIGYLHYFQQLLRNGKALASEFIRSGISNIEYNRFTPDRLAISLHVSLGQLRVSAAKIEYVDMKTTEVYPSTSMSYAGKPLGKARIRNVTDRPIAARVGFFINRYMDTPTQSESYTIPPQSVAEIPFSAIFNPVIKNVASMELCEGSVTVCSSNSDENDDQAPVRMIVYGKNDWDGKVQTLASFVTPRDPDVMFFTRSILNAHKDSLRAVPKQLERFEKARLLFNEFSKRMMYVNDPHQSKDNVQYPNETFALKGGDCDDMTVGFSSVLESIGISTAFVDVVPPDNPGNSHVYLLFDTGLEPEYGRLLTENEKRYIIRVNNIGSETVWIPVETTMLISGFEMAWEKAAEEFLEEARVKDGLAKGWVQIVNVTPQ
ncbi:MAG: hypothetical protein ABSB78_07535 [Bacteroidota bacterium]